MNPVHHPYIFETRRWQRNGSFCPARDSKEYKLTGVIQCTRNTTEWQVNNVMFVALNQPLRIAMLHTVQNSQSNKTEVTWSSYNTEFGTMDGRFVIFSDIISSTWTSDNGFSSQVLSTKINDQKYQETGVVFTPQNEIFSQWTSIITPV